MSPAWAKGYPMEKLTAIAGIFKREFKPHSYGAFGVPKERDVANAWADGQLGFTDTAACIFNVLSSASYHSDFSGTQVARIHKGDLFIKHIAGVGKAHALQKLIDKAGAAHVWVEAHVENEEVVQMLQDLAFWKVLTKVSASSDIKGLFYRGNAEERMPQILAAEEIWGLKRLHGEIISPVEQHVILEELTKYEATEPWKQHYSTYNKRSSWTAFALRGYDSADPGFIIKPMEMSRKWREENSARLSSPCVWTLAANHFERTLQIIERRIPCQFQRIRLMRLSANGGELTRHADITDPEAGVRNGHVARLHIPLKTTPGCEFRSWGLDGRENRMHLPERSLTYLDTRKPHAVKNDGQTERIHLVIDAFSNDWLRECLNG